jgi:hypothetical protein
MADSISRVKPILFFFNLFFFFAGITIFAIGIWIKFSDFGIYTAFQSSNKEARFVGATGYILIGLGVFITIVYFLGCCGTCSESAKMMYTFSVIVAILILTEIAISIVFFIYKGHAKEIAKVEMENGLVKYNLPNYDAYTNGWDKIQTTFECCGIVHGDDWKTSPFYETTNGTLPTSCCETSANSCTNFYQDGCYVQFEEYFELTINVIGSIIIGTATLQAIFNIIACYFAKVADDGYNNWYSMLSFQRYSPC